MRHIEYDRTKAIEYASRWATARNPAYYNFENYNLGGDCTNFVSQCLFNGNAVMNFNRDGWFYRNLNNRSLAWTGVEALFNFLNGNKGAGPYGHLIALSDVEEGDIIQLSFGGKIFSQSLIVTKINFDERTRDTVFTATHTFDSLNRRLGTYFYDAMRVIHIDGIRAE